MFAKWRAGPGMSGPLSGIQTHTTYAKANVKPSQKERLHRILGAVPGSSKLLGGSVDGLTIQGIIGSHAMAADTKRQAGGALVSMIAK